MYHEDLPSHFKQGYVLNKRLADGNWTVTSNKDSTIIYTEGGYLNNRKNGLWKNYDYDGALSKTVEYKNGKITGTTKTYHKNGNIAIRLTHLKKKSYIAESYYSTGILSSKYQSKNGKKHGIWKEYFINGKIKSIVNFKKGLKTGLQKNYNKDGVMINEVYIKN
jgi:antitoxin component YwqK of YwqJK toxin-antitoxin module